ncbi:unnamed protein product, partial [marine sediment metagenome]
IGDFYSQDDTLLATGFARTISEGESFTLDPGEIGENSVTLEKGEQVVTLTLREELSAVEK